jgi:hypothetical protein
MGEEAHPAAAVTDPHRATVDEQVARERDTPRLRRAQEAAAIAREVRAAVELATAGDRRGAPAETRRDGAFDRPHEMLAQPTLARARPGSMARLQARLARGVALGLPRIQNLVGERLRCVLADERFTVQQRYLSHPIAGEGHREHHRDDRARKRGLPGNGLDSLPSCRRVHIGNDGPGSKFRPEIFTNPQRSGLAGRAISRRGDDRVRRT